MAHDDLRLREEDARRMRAIDTERRQDAQDRQRRVGEEARRQTRYHQHRAQEQALAADRRVASKSSLLAVRRHQQSLAC